MAELSLIIKVGILEINHLALTIFLDLEKNVHRLHPALR